MRQLTIATTRLLLEAEESLGSSNIRILRCCLCAGSGLLCPSFSSSSPRRNKPSTPSSIRPTSHCLALHRHQRSSALLGSSHATVPSSQVFLACVAYSSLAKSLVRLSPPSLLSQHRRHAHSRVFSKQLGLEYSAANFPHRSNTAGISGWH